MIDVDTLEQIISDFEGNVHSTEFAKELIKHLERSLPMPEASEVERVVAGIEALGGEKRDAWGERVGSWREKATVEEVAKAAIAAMNKPAVVDGDGLIKAIRIKLNQIKSEGYPRCDETAQEALELLDGLRVTKPVEGEE